MNRNSAKPYLLEVKSILIQAGKAEPELFQVESFFSQVRYKGTDESCS